MTAIMADNDIEGQFGIVFRLLTSREWFEFWNECACDIVSFESLGIDRNATDRELWMHCQAQDIVLITGNRNQDGVDSLEATLRDQATDDALPVLTIGEPKRIQRDKDYLQRVAARMVEYLMDIDDFRGTARLYIP